MTMKKVYVWLIFVVSVIVSLYFGFQKSGFHEDEYYTYFSSNRTMGLYQPDRQWQDRQTILDEFSVKKGEGFNYGLVKLVQSWDVHPPLYYWIFHTICSLTPGVFTKWSGLIANLIAFCLAFWLLYRILEELETPLVVEVLTLAFYGLNPQTISCNMLIRMYAWLTAAVFACALVHICFIKKMKNANRFDFETEVGKKSDSKGISREAVLAFAAAWGPIVLVSYLGFLIQYFYLYFWAGIGAFTFLWLCFSRFDFKRAFIYAGSNVLALGLAVLTYPSSVRHMFGGYRGSEAAGGLFDLGNTWMRVSFFIGLLNDFVFGKCLLIVITLILMGTLYLNLRRSREVATGHKQRYQSPRPEILALVVATAVYFLLTAKTALLVGAASNRYEMPVYGLIGFIIIWDVYMVFTRIEDYGKGNRNRSFVMIIMVFFAVLILKSLVVDDNVLFLYKEDTEKIAYAANHSGEVAVVMYNPATPQNVWRLTDELLQYDRVFYMDEENLEPLTEAEITGASEITLYAADDPMQIEAFGNLLDSCPGISTMAPLFVEDMWSSYVLK